MEAYDAGGGPARADDPRVPRVRAYVGVLCAPDRAEDAEAAALVDFLARTGGDLSARAEQIARELLQATRSAAAGRFSVVVPVGHPATHVTAECRAMPELLAAYANGERPEDEPLIAGHLAGCAVCAHTLDRMHEADRAFAREVGQLPQLEVEEWTVDTTRVAVTPTPTAVAPPPMAETKPLPEPDTARPASASGEEQRVPEPPAETRPAPAGPRPSPVAPRVPSAQPHTVYRRRSGGLVGAIRKLTRPSGE